MAEMKYAVIVGPSDKGGSEHAGGIQSWDAFWEFNRSEMPKGMQKWKECVRFPVKQKSTLKFDIHLPDEENRNKSLIGLADISGTEFFVRDLLLWLPNSLFPGQVPPDALNVQRTNPVNVSAQFIFFVRQQAEGIRTPKDVHSKVAEGTLFEHSETLPAEKESHYFLRVVSEANEAEKGKKREGIYHGIYNPWIMVLDTANPVVYDEGDPSRTWLAQEMKRGAVDVHINVPEEDRLRVRVHAGLSSSWADVGGGTGRPVIPRLLFGKGPRSPALTRAFAVLDSLHGEFRVEGFAAPDAPNPRLVWIPPDNLCWEARLRNHRLVTEAVELLDLEVEMPKSGRDADAEVGAGVEDDAGDAEDNGERATLSDVLGCTFSGMDRVPPPLITLADTLSKAGLDTLSLGEREEIEKAVRAGDDGNFLRWFATAHLLPRSRIRVRVPSPPEWLEPDARKKWETLRKTQLYDPAAGEGVVAEGEDRKRHMPVWWLQLIQPDDESTPSGAHPWEAWTHFWKSQFHIALFRAPSQFVPTWKPPDPGGQLGRSVLGKDLLLGTFWAHQTKTSFPDMHHELWPLTNP